MDLNILRCYKKIMGILSNLASNPSVLLIAGLGVALFVFRDKISGFFF